jgi:hypothetical protein
MKPDLIAAMALAPVRDPRRCGRGDEFAWEPDQASASDGSSENDGRKR